MSHKIVIGPINKGLKTDRTAFNIDNDSFPTLLNAYQWRGRVKRKRGTSLLNRLKRYFNSSSTSYSSTATINLSGGAANILSGFSLQSNAGIVPGSITIVDSTASNTYTDPSMNGTLVGAPSGSGTINYASGAITIVSGASNTISVSFNYYPNLPVMGLEDRDLNPTESPGTIAFDTVYSYNVITSSPYNIYDISFYKNPPSATYTAYVRKTNWTPTTWNGQSYQQFWTVNYAGAFWATNGVTVPFTVTNIGMQYKAIVAVTVVTPTTANLQITGHGLVVGDFLFINEVLTTTGINFQTGYVVTVTDANNVVVKFPNATLTSNGTLGIAQYLTNRSDTTKDCLRFYDGDPTNGNSTTPTLNGNHGWVNFAPPLNFLSSNPSFSIANLAPAQYYLVGAKMILPFKDRLLFIGPVIQTSSAGSQVYLQDTVIYSQDGTPYYTASYTNTPSSTVDTPLSVTNVYAPILTPDNQTAAPNAYFEDNAGFGGFVMSGLNQPIITSAPTQDVIIMGMPTIQTKFVYTGNDIIPFLFYVVNSELGSSSTFSSVNVDRGVISLGSRGYIIAGQTEVSRIDPDIPDQVFQISLLNNGAERVCAQRDFLNEWIYFTYPSNTKTSVFPSQTLQYNYRDDSWAIFNESYTTYGAFRKRTGFTWSTIGSVFSTWRMWNQPWNAGASTLLQPVIIAGNQQGFIVFRGEGTGEANSLYISNISSGVVTSPSHGLSVGDYIVITGVLGTSGMNGNIFSVQSPVTENTFTLNPGAGAGTYLGGGVIKRMYVPLIQTKQFPVAWDMARKTRIGVQQYLFTKTSNSQITLLIYLSQDGSNPYNTGPILPSDNSINNSLIYSSVLYTCPESTNLGLTPANINLNMITASQQEQIWHRNNTSLIGDTIQIGFTLNDDQMRDTNFRNQFAEIEFHSAILDVSPSMLLA